MTVLFVNACLRGDESRTLTLCREYLEGIEDVKEVNLSEMRLEPYYGRLGGLSRPVGGQGACSTTPCSTLARTSPRRMRSSSALPTGICRSRAALKIYIEHAAVMGMTFHYTEEGRCEGLCRAKHLTYITTAAVR